MTVKTFERGVFLPHYKEFTEEKAITDISLPEEVVIPLQQHTGAPCNALVKEGDKIAVGQKIGSSEAFVSAAVHSSVDGTVTAVEPRANFTGAMVNSVVIKVDAEQKAPELKDNDTGKLNADQIRGLIREAGIVGMGGAAFPTHVKLSPPKAIDAVIINACECEPFLTCDHRLMLERTYCLIEGTKLIAKAVDAPRIYFGVETNKADAIEVLQGKLEQNMEVVSLDVKYPQGAEKQLIKAVLDREVPPGKLPFDVGVIVQNVATAIAVFEAVKFEKPLYERVLTVTGDAAANPGNVKVRIGTSMEHVINQCGGTRGEVARVVMGGPMTGWAQANLNASIVKGSSGILLLSAEMAVEDEYLACVRCGKCVEHCPMGLYPNYVGMYSETGRHSLSAEWGAMDCFECGVCVYVCPSNRPIVGFVRDTKKEMAARR